jgi:hypothetical protein
VKQVQAAAFFSEPQIDHFVMAITSAETFRDGHHISRSQSLAEIGNKG